MGILDQLQTAGFSPDELGEFAAKKRQTYAAAGFSNEEINDYLGGQHEVSIPAALGRDFGEGAGKVVSGVLKTAGGTLGRVADAVVGSGSTAIQDAFFKTADSIRGSTHDYYGLKPDEHQGLGAKIAGAVGGFLPYLAGGAAAPALMGNTAAQDMNTDMMADGATPQQATGASLAAYGINAAAGMIPMGVGGAVAKKLGVTSLAGRLGLGAAGGAATQEAVGPASRVAQNAALPEGEQFDNLRQETFQPVSDAVMGAGFGGLHVATDAKPQAKSPPKPQLSATEQMAANRPFDPETARPVEDIHAENRAAVDAATGVKPDDIVTQAGAPFKTKLGAKRALADAGDDHEVVTVQTGYVVRKKPEAEQPAEIVPEQAPEQNQTTDVAVEPLPNPEAPPVSDESIPASEAVPQEPIPQAASETAHADIAEAAKTGTVEPSAGIEAGAPPLHTEAAIEHPVIGQEGVAPAEQPVAPTVEQGGLHEATPEHVTADVSSADLHGLESKKATETPEFKKWFGDSKVVDEEGKPLTLYHGTTKDVASFDPEKIGSNFGLDKDGFFFTSDRVTASVYSRAPKTGANVIPVHLALKKPLTLEEYTHAFSTDPSIALDREDLSLTNYFDDNRRSIMDFAKSRGYDGVLFQRDGETLGVALHPEQIKSAIGNRGTFDPNDPHIDAMASGTEGPLDKPLYSAIKDGSTASSLLKTIAEQSDNPMNREVAAKLLNAGVDSAVKKSDRFGGKFIATYNHRSDEIHVYSPKQTEHAILHEAVHAATVRAINAGTESGKAMADLYKQVKAAGLTDHYGMKNAKEFVAEAFSNHEFQDALRGVKLPDGNLWERFKSAVKKIIGIDDTTLEKVLKAGDRLIAEQSGKPVLTDHFGKIKSTIGDFTRAVAMPFDPMSASKNERAQAMAKDFANATRKADYQWNRTDEILRKEFTFDEQKDMGRALAEQSVLSQLGKEQAGAGIDRLPPEQKAAVKALSDYNKELTQRGQEVGMFPDEPIPDYFPYLGVDVAPDGSVSNLSSNGAKGPLESLGKNFRTTTAQLKKRNNLTPDDFKQAIKARFGDNAQMVENIRALPMVMGKLERAIAARELINAIKEEGKNIGIDAVSETPGKDYFTLANPAFTEIKPRLADGKAVKDEDGNVIFDRKPLYMHKDFEGPIRAVLQDAPGVIAKSLMAMKSTATGLLMWTPMIHNMVVLGKALPAYPLKTLSTYLYWSGHSARMDPVTMRDMLDSGMVPQTRYGYRQNVTDLVTEKSPKGDTLLSKGLGAAGDLAHPKVGQALRTAVDATTDFMHNTLLWNRVADLQAGIWLAAKKQGMSRGLDEQSAARVGAELANRFVGSIPHEAMSKMARDMTNFVFFSRQFTLSNLSLMTGMFTGLSPAVRAQIRRDAGPVAALKANRMAKVKQGEAFLMDMAMSIAGVGLAQSFVQTWKGDKTWGEEGDEFMRRFEELSKVAHDDPKKVLSSPLASMESLSPAAPSAGGTFPGNEPGKENRVDIGQNPDGTHIYLRLPFGKVGEEFRNYLDFPKGTIKQLMAKESTLLRPIIETATNDAGFGRKVYNDVDKTPGSNWRALGQIATHALSSQAPLDAYKAAWNLASGKSQPGDMAVEKTLYPALGFTVSKGAPGGPAEGERYTAMRAHEANRAMAMPDIREAVKAGDIDKGAKLAQDAGMTPADFYMVVRETQNPGPSKSAMRRFARSASAEEMDRYQKQLQKQ